MTPNKSPQPTAPPRETITVAIGPNDDGLSQQATAAQTLDDAAIVPEPRTARPMPASGIPLTDEAR